MSTIEESATDSGKQGFRRKLEAAVDRTITSLFIFYVFLFFLRLLEYFHVSDSRVGFFEYIFNSLNFDLFYSLTIGLICFIPIFLIGLISKAAAQVLFVTVLTLFIICELALQQYFFQAMVPLGADFWAYSYDEMKHTVGAAGGISAGIVILFIVFVGVFAVLNLWALKFSARESIQAALKKLRLALVLIALISPFMIKVVSPAEADYKTELGYFQASNKMAYFINKTLEYRSQKNNTGVSAQILAVANADNQATAGNSSKPSVQLDPNYPFLKMRDDTDALGSFFNKGTTRPNIVLILVESLGRAYSGPDAYLGSFTPFLDSLGAHSLYWSNFLSTGGRTFAVLPSSLGSLPFADKGFLEQGDAMPDHITLASILERNGYSTNFYYGGDSHFDNMDIFMKKNGVTIHDIKSFDNSYLLLPSNAGNPSWGYEDRELFRHYLATLPDDNKPRLDVMLTVANHSPFLVHNQQYYLDLFEAKLKIMQFTANHPESDYEEYKMKYSTIMYTDNSIRYFINEYSKKPSFKNTIFIITGDHRMPEIPIATLIDRFHVPLIIYSPMLKQGQRFEGVSSQYDITPTLLSFLAKNYGVKTPSVVAWIGEMLDIDHSFRCRESIPLMRNKNELFDYLDGGYFVAENQLFRLYNNMDIEPTDDENKLNQVKAKFDVYKMNNKKACGENKIIPDSIRNSYEAIK